MASCRRISLGAITVLVALCTLGCTYLAIVAIPDDMLPLEVSQGKSSIQRIISESEKQSSKLELAINRAAGKHGASRQLINSLQNYPHEQYPDNLGAVPPANFNLEPLNRKPAYVVGNNYIYEDTSPEEEHTPEELVEHSRFGTYRTLTTFEQNGGDILLSLRTTGKYHNKRLPLLFKTWMTKINLNNLFIVTDRLDEYWINFTKQKGVHYVNAECGKSYLREELCCKAGVEMQLLFQEGNEKYNWLCHVDDDMYVIGKPLIKTLSKFNPTREPVYFGRSGSAWKEPRKVLNTSTLGTPGQGYHFAVGGMYCLSRAMLELVKPYLVGGQVFARSCSQTKEPEDVTVGVVVGPVLNMSLSRTELINTHGLHLASTVLPETLHLQIAVSYGFGSEKWGYSNYNAVYVPFPLYALSEDESQFRSIHCHLYPTEKYCKDRTHLLERLNRTIQLYW